MDQDDRFFRDVEVQISRGLPGEELRLWAKEQRRGLPRDYRDPFVPRLRSLAALDPCRRAAYLAICEGLEQP